MPTSPLSDEEHAWRQADAKKREEERITERLLETARIPGRYLEGMTAAKASSHTKWNANMEAIRGMLGRGVVIALLGKRGTGKTQAGTLAIWENCHRQKSARYINAITFYMQVRGTYREKSETTEAQVIASNTSPSLLVIDEVHERGDTPWVDRMLTYLVDQRHQEMKDTILIANQTPAEFSASVGSSVVDRAREGGGVLVFDWDSFRGAKL